MFSFKEKQIIADKIEKILLDLKHPEMPDNMPIFELHVEGKERWSWTNIAPNWTFKDGNKPSINLFNEIARKLRPKDK